MSIALEKLIARSQRELFFPLVFRLAMRLEQTTWEEMCADPGLATFTLRASQRLFKAAAMVAWFDGHLEAEAAGAELIRDDLGVVRDPAQPPAKVPSAAAIAGAAPIMRAVEIARRLVAETKDEACVVGCLSGGATLLARLYGTDRQAQLLARLAKGPATGADKDMIDAACQASVAIVKAYCEAGVGALLLIEDQPRVDFSYLKAFEPVANLAAYYGVPRLLVCRAPLDAAASAGLLAAGYRGIAAEGAGYGAVSSIPLDLFAGGIERIASWRATRAAAPKPRLLMSEWELPASAAPESVIALQESLAR